jgi:serine/threonine-protein kinase RsbW
VGAPPEPFSGVWAAVPESVPRARRAVVEYLRAVDGIDVPVDAIETVVSEAVTNAVTHAYAGTHPGEVRLRVELRPDVVEVVVEDDGRGMVPRGDSPGLGLGLPLITTLSRRVDARSLAGGGTRLAVWFDRYR